MKLKTKTRHTITMNETEMVRISNIVHDRISGVHNSSPLTADEIETAHKFTELVARALGIKA
jgi:hypothetical protein